MTIEQKVYQNSILITDNNNTGLNSCDAGL